MYVRTNIRRHPSADGGRCRRGLLGCGAGTATPNGRGCRRVIGDLQQHATIPHQGSIKVDYENTTFFDFDADDLGLLIIRLYDKVRLCRGYKSRKASCEGVSSWENTIQSGF